MNKPARIQQHVSLKGKNTLHLPCEAEFFAAPDNTVQLVSLLEQARQQKWPVTILGEGSNVLLKEAIPGLVLQPSMLGIRLLEDARDYVIVEAGAGENWDQFVAFCLQQGWYGLENLSLIPGSVGAAPVQNIGAYGVELKDVFASLDAIRLDKPDPMNPYQVFSREECQFSYRDSLFKSRYPGEFCIVNVRFRLRKSPHCKTEYGQLMKQVELLGEETPENVRHAVCEIRQSKLPDPELLPNAGSFFKNPVLDEQAYNALLDILPGAVAYKQPYQHYKIAAGWLLEQAGYKGRKQGNLSMHEQQALVLVNHGCADFQEVMAFTDNLIEDVYLRYKVRLEREPVVLPCS